MAKIELSLKSNIESIVASGLFGYKLKESELTPLVYRISKNFYNTYTDQLAHTALGIWGEHHDRKHVHKILTIAYDIESDWRDRNQTRYKLLCTCNPYSYDTISYNDLLLLNPQLELELRNKLSCLSDEDFRTTPYYKVIKTKMLQHCGGQCMMRINGVQCGATQNLELFYVNLEHARGLEHRNWREDCTIVCEDCAIRSAQVAQSVI